jgi:hypothetical protein
MLRVFADHNCFPRFLLNFSSTESEEETRAFDTIFYGPPNALIARGIFLATINIIIVWQHGREVAYPIHIYESIGLSRAPVLINICHGLYGARLRECRIEVNDIRLANRERFCFKARLEHGDKIKIIPIGDGLWGGSQQNAVIPPLGENESQAAPEALPTYQQSIEASQGVFNGPDAGHYIQVIFNDRDAGHHNIQPVPDNNQQIDDDDDVYEDAEEEEEEEKEKLSIEEQIVLAQQKLNNRKRKLEQLDAEYERVEKEDREGNSSMINEDIDDLIKLALAFTVSSDD